MPPISIDNEKDAWQYIKAIALQNLKNYPNSLEEDNEILEQDDLDHKLGFNKRNCVIFRMTEKKPLHYFIWCADKVD